MDFNNISFFIFFGTQLDCQGQYLCHLKYFLLMLHPIDIFF